MPEKDYTETDKLLLAAGWAELSSYCKSLRPEVKAALRGTVVYRIKELTDCELGSAKSKDDIRRWTSNYNGMVLDTLGWKPGNKPYCLELCELGWYDKIRELNKGFDLHLEQQRLETEKKAQEAGQTAGKSYAEIFAKIEIERKEGRASNLQDVKLILNDYDLDKHHDDPNFIKALDEELSHVYNLEVRKFDNRKVTDTYLSEVKEMKEYYERTLGSLPCSSETRNTILKDLTKREGSATSTVYWRH